MKFNKICLSLLLFLAIFLSASCAFAQDSQDILGVDDISEPEIGINSEIYISPDGTGSGSSADNPSNWNSAYSKANNGDTIIFLNGTYTSLINKNIAKSVELRGSGNSVVDANNRTGFFTIYSGVTVKLTNLVIFNGETGDTDAGAIVNNGNLIVNRTYFSSSSGWGTEGGAIHNNGYCAVYDSTFFNNTAKKGGSIYVSEKGQLDVYNSTFIRGSSKSGNCFNIDGGVANVYNCFFVNCSAKSSIIYVDKKSYVHIENCSFSSSRAVADAAAIYGKKESNVYVNNCSFVKCNAIENGGAISTEGNMNINNCSFINCSAVINGGAIFSKSKGSIVVTDSLFIGNKAVAGRHIYSEKGAISLTNCILEAENTLTTSNIASGEVEVVDVAIDEGTNFLQVNVNLLLNNKTVIGSVSNDYAFDLKELPDGIYTVSLASKDNSNGNSYIYTNPVSTFKVGNVSSGNATLDDNKTSDDNKTDFNIVLNAPDVVKYYHGGERFVVSLKDSKDSPIANETVSISINGMNYNRNTDVNGEASIPLGLNCGEYDVLTVYRDINYNSKVKILATVNASDVTKVFRNGTQYYAAFVDSAGKLLTNRTVSFNINGVYYNRTTDDKGVAQLNINLHQGEYILTAINPESGEMATNIIKVIPSLAENKDIVKYYRNATPYSVKVLGSDGNALANATVTFNINGVFYNRTTDANGIASLNLNLQPGNYVITAEYNDCRVSNNIEIKPVLFGDDLTKKYASSDQFIAKLVDGHGSPLSGENITFNINGVFYNRTTDSNGLANLNINLQSGEYIITSSYNGANIANKVTIV